MKEIKHPLYKEIINDININNDDTFGMPFPNGQMNPALLKFGFKEEDIVEIREILLKEIKKQNDNENKNM